MLERAALQAVDAAGHAALDLVGLEAGAQVLGVHAGGAVRLEAVGALAAAEEESNALAAARRARLGHDAPLGHGCVEFGHLGRVIA